MRLRPSLFRLAEVPFHRILSGSIHGRGARMRGLAFRRLHPGPNGSGMASPCIAFRLIFFYSETVFRAGSSDVSMKDGKEEKEAEINSFYDCFVGISSGCFYAIEKIAL